MHIVIVHYVCMCIYRKQYVGCRIFWKGREPSNFFYTRLDLCEFQLVLLLDLLCVCTVCTITGCVYDECAVLQIYLLVGHRGGAEVGIISSNHHCNHNINCYYVYITLPQSYMSCRSLDDPPDQTIQHLRQVVTRRQTKFKH